MSLVKRYGANFVAVCCILFFAAEGLVFSGCQKCQKPEEANNSTQVKQSAVEVEPVSVPVETNAVSEKMSEKIPVEPVAVASLEEHGVKVAYNNDKTLKSLDFSDQKQPVTLLPDEENSWKSVRVIRGKGNLPFALLEICLTQMPQLKEFLWTETVIESDTTIENCRCAELKKLRLSGLTVSENHRFPVTLIKSFDVCKNLSEFDLSGSSLTDSDLNDLKLQVLFPKLERLNLYQTRITDEGVEQLLPLAETINWLNLDATGIDDSVMNNLTKFQQLTFLHIGRTSVSDASIELLATFPELKKIHVTRTQISEKGAEKLRALLPDCEVVSEVEE
ncbi:MAG: hypothetical protein IKW74_07680 [Thermoguttaceae bacterium]|nr:hypothetical protein [Thermoguttaceae bacterium]